MEFTRHGLGVYSSEVDDRGIDFVLRTDGGRYYDVQVKSSRSLNYIFFAKSKFELRENLYAVVALFFDGELPQLYLIPSTAWHNTDALLVTHDYEGGKSKPEWGLNLSHKNLGLLARFHFGDVVHTL